MENIIKIKMRVVAWECVTGIGDQYNFCIKRAADSPQKCTAWKRGRNCTIGEDVSSLKCSQTAVHCTAMHKWSGFHISQPWRLESGGEGGKLERGGEHRVAKCQISFTKQMLKPTFPIIRKA